MSQSWQMRWAKVGAGQAYDLEGCSGSSHNEHSGQGRRALTTCICLPHTGLEPSPSLFTYLLSTLISFFVFDGHLQASALQ